MCRIYKNYDSAISFPDRMLGFGLATVVVQLLGFTTMVYPNTIYPDWDGATVLTDAIVRDNTNDVILSMSNGKIYLLPQDMKATILYDFWVPFTDTSCIPISMALRTSSFGTASDLFVACYEGLGNKLNVQWLNAELLFVGVEAALMSVTEIPGYSDIDSAPLLIPVWENNLLYYFFGFHCAVYSVPLYESEDYNLTLLGVIDFNFPVPLSPFGFNSFAEFDADKNILYLSLNSNFSVSDGPPYWMDAGVIAFQFPSF